MNHTILTLVVSLCLISSPIAWQETTKSVAGQWDLTVQSPHGEIPMSMSLEQDVKSVKGTLTSGMGERKLSGEFDTGSLKAQAWLDDGSAWIVTAKLMGTGALQGVISTSVSDLQFTAERVPAETK